MKKIALLFIFLCVGALNGMESAIGPKGLKSYDLLEDISAIKGPRLLECEAQKIIKDIKKGVDVNFTGNLKQSPLQLAIILSNLSVVEILLEAGATVTDETLWLADNMKKFTSANRTLDARLQSVEDYKRWLEFRAIGSSEYQERLSKEEKIIPLIVQTLKNTKKEDYKTSSDNAVEIY